MSRMRKTIAALFVGLVALAPVPGGAWGFDAHRFVMDRAIPLLPDPLRPLFEQHRAMAVERSIDPDTWINAGFEQEAPNHFLDLDWEGYGKYPFAGLPHDLTAAIAKFGRERVEENGMVPWRAEEFFGNLRRAFESYGRRGKFGQFHIIFFSSTLAHYVSDAHVPFHSVLNYDGQLSNQHGIHARFESIMFERYRNRLTVAPKPARGIANPREYLFEVLKEGTQLVPPILESDLEALAGRDVYDEAYYDRFFAANRPVMERRLNEAISAVAGMIVGAWEAAGKPAIPLNPRDQPQRKRKS
jgi:hypothetical protein